MSAALEGVSVLDLTHCIAGPYCTRLLAGFGADVLKIEPPGGEGGRRMAPFFRDEPGPDSSLPFAYLNTGKRSMTLNLKTEEGRDILRSLLPETDVLVENFAPRVMPSLGLGYDSLREIAPHLVMASISNFGQTGPYRDFKAADIVEYALGGLMYIFGAYDREPPEARLQSGAVQGRDGCGLGHAYGPLPSAHGGKRAAYRRFDSRSSGLGAARRGE